MIFVTKVYVSFNGMALQLWVHWYNKQATQYLFHEHYIYNGRLQAWESII